MRRSLLLLPFCLVAAALAGCGNKGPLVFPPTRPASAATAPAPAALPPVAAPADNGELPADTRP